MAEGEGQAAAGVEGVAGAEVAPTIAAPHVSVAAATHVFALLDGSCCRTECEDDLSKRGAREEY